MSEVIRSPERESRRDAPALRRRKVLGIFERKERWGLSSRGVFIALVLLIFCSWLFIAKAYSFLAVREPVATDVLVVEGWIDNWACALAAAEFQRGNYKLVITTGGPIPGTGGYTNDFNTSASVGAERLIGFGVPRERVRIAPCRESARDRTYSSALALRRWLAENATEVRAFNVLTETTHARRTWLLFQKAFRSEIRVGIIPVVSPDFDPREWWRYSEGVRDVIGEVLAYSYARLFFWPRPPA